MTTQDPLLAGDGSSTGLADPSLATATPDPSASTAMPDPSISTATPDPSSSFAQIPFGPSEVDLMPPIVHSLVTLMRLRGKNTSTTLIYNELVELGEGNKISIPSALRGAHKLGLNARIVRRYSLAELTPVALPCIALLQNQQSCVLISKDETTAKIILPEEGEEIKSISLEDLEASYWGYCIFGNIEQQLDGRVGKVTLLKTKRWFWDTLIYFWPIYQHVVVASIIINIIGIASSLFAMNVYDRVVPNNAIETLWVLAIGIGLAYLCEFILRNLRNYFVDVAGRNTDVLVSSKLLDKVLTMRFEHKPESTGALVNNLREFESLREFFSSGTLLAFVDLPFLILYLVLITFIGGPLVFVPLLAVPLMLGAGVYLNYRSLRPTEMSFKQNMHKNAMLVELVNGLEILKLNQAETRARYQWEQAVGSQALSASQTRKFASLATTFTTFLSQIINVVTIIWGVYLIAQGSLTMGGLVGCTILIGRAMAPLMQISAMLSRLQQSRLALQALDLIMALPSENDQASDSVVFENLHPAISLEDVSFFYPQAKQPSLEGVSFKLQPGEKVGIIGRMGSGKSTLGKLIAGLYEPQKGTVRLDDVDIRQLNTSDLRSRLGFLPQDVVLFYGSIRDNLILGTTLVSDRMLARAAWLSGVNEFVKTNPAGYATAVGERGMNLSGGQRQSIALGRALLKDSPIIILDEPTSNMDNMTERLVQNRLKTMLSNKTLVLITHRLSMLELVDRVIVMEKGKILADGPRDIILKGLQGGQA